MFVKDVVGQGITTSMSMAGGDLGIMRWDAQRGCIAALFGDNFSQPNLQGDWKGPSFIMYDAEYNPQGIPSVNDQGFKSIGVNMPVQSLWDIEHTVDPPMTCLPTDFIYLNDHWIVSVMLTAGLGHELTTEFHTSTDLVAWDKDPIVTLTHPSHPGNVMLTYDHLGDFVYILGTGGLARNKPLWLWRSPVHDFPRGYWEPYGHTPSGGWQWGAANEQTPILDGSYGELSLRFLNPTPPPSSTTPDLHPCNKVPVLAYFDAGDYCTSLITAPTVEEFVYNSTKHTFAYGELPSWAAGNEILDDPVNVTPNLYSPNISPLSELTTTNGLDLFISQWNVNHYRVQLHQTTVTPTLPTV